MLNSIDQSAMWRRAAAQAEPRRMRGAASAMQLVALVVAIALIAAGAWWFMRPAGPLSTSATTTPSATPTPGTSEEAAPPPQMPALSVSQLYQEARKAMSENRMVAPAGNNALEFYLSIMARQPDDAGATDAVRELFPFATGSAEDQINQGDFDEASRIMNLLAKADPSNYTLTILRSKLDAKKRQSERELAQQTAAAAAAAARAQTTGTTTATAAAEPAATANETPATVPAAAPKPVDVANAPPPPSAVPPPPAPAPEPVGETRDVRVLTPPRPTYPAAAARNRQDGWVEVEFTVGVDGNVQNAKVVASNPARLFDREAVTAIQQAKFEPRLDKGQPVATTLRRRIEFKLAN